MSVIRKSIPLLIVVAFVLCAVLPFLVYAYVAIDSSVDVSAEADGENHVGNYKRTVFTTNLIGYTFYADSDQVCVYRKTTDGGYTWATDVNIASCDGGLDIWYDQWTPGDTTGTIIHIIVSEDGADDIFYNTLDTSNDSVGTAVNISDSPGSDQGGGFAEGENFPTITKATNGVLYAGMVDNADQFVLECSSTCGTASNWAEVGSGTTVFSGLNADDDAILLLPLADGDILAIANDTGDNDYKSKVWDDGGGAWDTNWTNIDTNAPEYVGLDGTLLAPQMAATLNKSTNDIYFTYISDNTGIARTSPTNNIADIRTALYSGGSWSAKTNVATNVGSTTDAVGIAYDMANNRVFVAFSMAEDMPKQVRPAYNIFYKLSSDDMTTWSATSGPIGTYSTLLDDNPKVFEYDIYGLGLNMMSSFKIFATWFDDTGDEIRGVIVEDRLISGTHTRVTFRGDVKFNVTLSITGALSKLAGTFVIDHPLKPFTHLLYHSFVESPDAKNIYDGVATLDQNGEVTIALPDYFEALNKDFRYQFFPHGSPMPNLYVKEEVRDNRFVIAGGVPGGEITWQITGTRHDPYITANPIRGAVPKGPNEEVDVGECLFEPLCR